MTQLSQLLAQQQQLSAQLAALNQQIAHAAVSVNMTSVQPLDQESLNRLLDQQVQQMPVSELWLFAGIAPSTYYRLRNELHSSRLGTVQAVLDALGYQLYVGAKGLVAK